MADFYVYYNDYINERITDPANYGAEKRALVIKLKDNKNIKKMINNTRSNPRVRGVYVDIVRQIKDDISADYDTIDRDMEDVTRNGQGYIDSLISKYPTLGSGKKKRST